MIMKGQKINDRYQIVNGRSLGMPYKQVLKRLKKVEERLLTMSY